MSAIELVDLLERAQAEAPTPEHVGVEYMSVGADERIAIFAHPDSVITVPVPRGGGRLTLACGIRTTAWDRIDGPVRFSVEAMGLIGTRVLLDHTLDPRHEQHDRCWAEFDLAVPVTAARIVLATRALAGAGHAWAGWGRPRFLPRRRRAARPRPRRRAPGSVFLVTADACRADFAESAQIATPQLDALAAEGVTFEHARAASTATPAGYASLLTGTGPLANGVAAEWGTLPERLSSLATELRAAGRRTLFAPSEGELGGDRQGFGAAFDTVVPCLGNPSQDGSVTTRRLLDALGRDGGSAVFAWVQYFDTHPPHRVPADLLARHYEADPRDPARADRTELIDRIYGIESVLELDRALGPLRAGLIDGRFLARIEDAASVLLGESADGPDLAHHVVALGPRARLGLEPRDFGQWLQARGAELARGIVAPELVEWAESARELIRESERDVRGWVEGVVDYRYPVAAARAAVEHVDAQLAQLVARLHDEGSYDDSTIVFTAPHGQCYGEGGNFFHHHETLEPVIRIPVVIKPPRSAGIAPARMRGVLDQVDVMPTLLDLLGLPVPRTCEGASRITEVRSLAAIPAHDSLTVGISGVDACLARGDVKLHRRRVGVTGPEGVWLDAGDEWRSLDEPDEPCSPPPDATERIARMNSLLNGRVGKQT